MSHLTSISFVDNTRKENLLLEDVKIGEVFNKIGEELKKL